MNTITAIILAAGKGTRMKSSMAKVLHEVFFKPMLHHVLDAVQTAGIEKTAVVVGHQHERVIQCLNGYTFTPVRQAEQLGTGHAVLCAEEACADSETILILCGDTPLIRPATLQRHDQSPPGHEFGPDPDDHPGRRPLWLRPDSHQ